MGNYHLKRHRMICMHVFFRRGTKLMRRKGFLLVLLRLFILPNIMRRGDNWLNVVACNDDDRTSFGKGGWKESRKRLKVNKDAERDEETGQVSPYKARGLTMDTRMQIIEVAQFEDAKIREDCWDRLVSLNSRMGQLLQERSQQIELAKIIYPVYDKNYSNWKLVVALTEKMEQISNKTHVVEDIRLSICNVNNKSSQLAADFVQSCCVPTSSSIESGLKNTKARW